MKNVYGWILVGVIFAVIVLWVSEPYFDLYYYKTVMDEGSCEGVEKYYTGEGFLEDGSGFLMERNNYPMSREQEFILTDFKVLPPGEVGNPDFDCEDISKAVWCIAREYQVECEYYYASSIGRRSGDRGHLGIECLWDGEWSKFY